MNYQIMPRRQGIAGSLLLAITYSSGNITVGVCLGGIPVVVYALCEQHWRLHIYIYIYIFMLLVSHPYYQYVLVRHSTIDDD